MLTFSNIFLQLFIAFLSSFILGIVCVNLLKKLFFYKKIYQPISVYTTHHSKIKSNTPTMGGIAIFFSLVFSIILFCDKNNHSVHTFLVAITSFFYIGLKDDISKIKKANNIGYSAKKKMLYIFCISILLYFLHIKYINSHFNSAFISFPYMEKVLFLPKYVYFLFFIFVVCGSSNAVNITDGLDGLATNITLICSATLLLICYFMINNSRSYFSNLMFISDVKQMMIICAILCGVCLAFLWYNSSPASIFMGDSGSLCLGASLGMISIIIKQEFLYAIVGIFFILSTLSVIIQVLYFRFSGGKRIFKMSPLHHHFEKIGVAETKIVSRATIFTSIFGIISIILLITK